MRFPRLSNPAWIAVLLCAGAFLIWSNAERSAHLQRVAGFDPQPPALDVQSPTGYTGQTRTLIIPAHNRESYGWVTQTQQAIHDGRWRLHHIDYENVPAGRPVWSAAPYRWWLTAVAWLDHMFSGRPIGASVERAALFADPLLHLLLLVSVTVFAAWRFGPLAAGISALAVVTLHPFSSGYIPGAPDDQELAVAVGLWSILLLMAGMHTRRGDGDSANRNANARRWFVASGIATGIGVWVDVGTVFPVAIAMLCGGALARWPRASDHAEPHGSIPWRAWGWSAAATILTAWLFEYAPAHLGGWELRSIHPVYGLALAGAAECLAWANPGSEPGTRASRLPKTALLTIAIAAAASLPIVMLATGNLGFLETTDTSYRISKLPDGIADSSLWAWAVHAGITSQVRAVLVPVWLLLPALVLFMRSDTPVGARRALAVTIVPAFLMIGLACLYLNFWHVTDMVLIALLIGSASAVTGSPRHLLRITWTVLALLSLLPGAIEIWPALAGGSQTTAPALEVDAVVERDLARWLARRSGSAEKPVAWAPPNTTNALHFYGGIGGIGTTAPENADGLSTSILLARSNAFEKAYAMITQRGINYIVIPSWESFLAEAAPSAREAPAPLLLLALKDWTLPTWLRSVPYQFTPIPGVEDYRVAVFEVVDEQSDAVATSRLAEYFAEMGELDRAAAVARDLERFPADVSALTARAQVAIARRNDAGYDAAMKLLKLRLKFKGDRFLPWDRRVSLAILLAREDDTQQTREQTERCLADANESRLRSLSPGMLFNLQLLSRALDLSISEPALDELAIELLPAELRKRLPPK